MGPAGERGRVAGAASVRAALARRRAPRAPIGAMIGRLPLTIGLLVGAAALCAVGWLALAAAGSALPTWAAVPAAALAGAAQPPLSPAMRARWSELMAPRAIERAYAFENTIQEVAFVVGPLLLSLLLVFADAAAAALLCGALVVLGAAVFASSAADPGRPGWQRRRHGASPLSVTGVRVLVGTRGLITAGLGVEIVCIPAYAIAHGGAALAGVILACWSFGSLAGAIANGLVRWRAPIVWRYLGALALGAVAMLALCLAPGMVVFAAFGALSGFGLAPWVAASDTLMQRLAPSGTLNEAFTWLASLGLVGEALGALLGGLLLDGIGLRGAIAVAGGLALAALGLALAGSGYLRIPWPEDREHVRPHQGPPLLDG